MCSGGKLGTDRRESDTAHKEHSRVAQIAAIACLSEQSKLKTARLPEHCIREWLEPGSALTSLNIRHPASEGTLRTDAFGYNFPRASYKPCVVASVYTLAHRRYRAKLGGSGVLCEEVWRPPIHDGLVVDDLEAARVEVVAADVGEHGGALSVGAAQVA
jgi:hypothetical protein